MRAERVYKAPPAQQTQKKKNNSEEIRAKKDKNERFVGHVVLRNGVAGRIDDPSGQRVNCTKSGVNGTKSGSSLGIEECSESFTTNSTRCSKLRPASIRPIRISPWTIWNKPHPSCITNSRANSTSDSAGHSSGYSTVNSSGNSTVHSSGHSTQSTRRATPRGNSPVIPQQGGRTATGRNDPAGPMTTVRGRGRGRGGRGHLSANRTNLFCSRDLSSQPPQPQLTPPPPPTQTQTEQPTLHVSTAYTKLISIVYKKKTLSPAASHNF